jgi:hypothetical protein
MACPPSLTVTCFTVSGVPCFDKIGALGMDAFSPPGFLHLSGFPHLEEELVNVVARRGNGDSDF